MIELINVVVALVKGASRQATERQKERDRISRVEDLAAKYDLHTENGLESAVKEINEPKDS